MTPLQIEMLLKSYYSSLPEPALIPSPPHEALIHFIEEGLVAGDGGGYMATPRGEAYVRGLMAVKLPVQVQRWEIPT